MRFIGDIHGNFYDYQLLASEVQESVQIGDFGIGFYSDYWHDRVADWQLDNPKHRFIRGNHDNLQKCLEMPGFIKDGTLKDRTMFVGGAFSIDRAARVEGETWWADEELSILDFYHIHQLYLDNKPEIMVTHDCPTKASVEMFWGSGLIRGKKLETRTDQALQAMWEMHQPKYWVFGHYHHTMTYKIGNTTFICVGENDYVDLV